MSGRRLLAYLLIAIGALALLARVGTGTGWLWAALAATGFLIAYRKERIYAFLVLGGILAGTAAGLLLEGAWGWPGAFLMALGGGFLAIDRVEPRPSRWPIYPAAALVALGLVYWLFRAGVLQSLWFPVVLIIAGVYLLRRREAEAWVRVDEDDVAPEATDGPRETGEPARPRGEGMTGRDEGDDEDALRPHLGEKSS